MGIRLLGLLVSFSDSYRSSHLSILVHLTTLWGENTAHLTLVFELISPRYGA